MGITMLNKKLPDATDMTCYQVKKSKSCLNVSSSENIPWHRRATLSLSSPSCPLPQLFFHHHTLPPNIIAIYYLIFPLPTSESQLHKKRDCFLLCWVPDPGTMSSTEQSMRNTYGMVNKYLPCSDLVFISWNWNNEEAYKFESRSDRFSEWYFTVWLELCVGWVADTHHFLIHLPCPPKLRFCCTGQFWWTAYLSSSAQNLELISVLPLYLWPYIVDEFLCSFLDWHFSIT